MAYSSVEANIGVGKSTLLPKLAKLLRVIPVEEDLSQEGEFLKALALYNEDKSEALNLQMVINEYRRDVAAATLFDGSYLVERSMISDIVFAKVMMERGEMSRGDFKLFNTLALKGLQLYPPELVIHLQCDPEVAYARMIGRGRAQESNNTLKYIMDLEEAHRKILPDICEDLGIFFLSVEYTNFCEPKEISDMIMLQSEKPYNN